MEAIGPFLDNPPVDINALLHGSLREKMDTLPSLRALIKTVRKLGADLPLFYDLLTAPATKVLDKWFESEPLKACLAMDSIIGATVSPSTPGSAYVLLHHVMGELEGRKSAWAYVEGGMGKLSQAIADSATSMGTTVLTNKPVKSFLLQGESKTAVSGVVLEDGTEIKADIVLSNATPKITFLDLLPKGVLSEELHKDISCFSYDSPVTKINVAVDKLPNFLAQPNKENGEASDHHRCTIHINTESMATIEKAYTDCLQGRPSDRPLIEMCIPSSLDPTLAPPGCHVLSLFIQYTPYHLKDGTWTDEKRNAYADKVFDSIEEYAPGFKSSVVGRDILTPPDLEKTFGLTGGNIFHGAMSLDQLYFARPVQALSNYRTPVKGLYLCGSGTHPGGGVMGASGRNAANTVLRDRNK